MKVKELIEFLGTFNPELEIAYQHFMEYTRMDKEYITVQELIPHSNDKYTLYNAHMKCNGVITEGQPYLVFIQDN